MNRPVQNNADLKLVLNWYEIKGEKLIDEEVIQGMSVEDILNLFEAPFWNNVYQCWAVNSSHISSLQKNVQHKFNTRKYTYFVEAYKLP